jgi:hypothetical protein
MPADTTAEARATRATTGARDARRARRARRAGAGHEGAGKRLTLAVIDPDGGRL